VLKDNPGGVMLLRDELSGWFGGMDAYAGGKGGKDAAFWLEAYNGGPMVVHRITRENLLIPNLSVNLLGGIQPSSLARIADKLPDDGLLQRFMVVIAQPVEGDGVDRAPDRASVEGWRHILDWLVTSLPRTQEPIRMSDAALTIRSSLSGHLETLRKSYGHLPRFASHLGKWPALFVRLCLVYHAAERANGCQTIEGEISGATAQQVARLMVDFLFEHTRFHEDILGDDWTTEHTRWIAGYILARKAKDITLRTIYRASKRFAALSELRKRDVIRCLEHSGWLIPVRQTHSGIPCSFWEVNPRVHELYAEHAGPEADRRSTARELIAAKARETLDERREERRLWNDESESC
jgi:hypothetical protein